jgi:hypothetical protein
MCSMLACLRSSMVRRQQHSGLSLLSSMVVRVPLWPQCYVAEWPEDRVGLAVADASWVPLDEFQKLYPTFKLEDELVQ